MEHRDARNINSGVKMSLNDATLRQIKAAEPKSSTWLAANAGSGKTKVLTDRVARLLLEDVMPQNILCLTYTKAAASEMQNRLFGRLGRWTMLRDEDLLQELKELGVNRVLSMKDLENARTLFARAIEAPGGLKIQTIHSFCSSVLRRFPLEAGVNPQFVEIDERAQKLLLDEVVETIADGTGPSSFDGIAHYFTGKDLQDVFKAILDLPDLFSKPNSLDEIWEGFNLQPGYTDDDLSKECFIPGDLALIQKLRDQLLTKAGNDLTAGIKLSGLKDAALTVFDLPLLESVFLTKSGAAPFTPKSTFPTKVTKAEFLFMPQLEALMLRVSISRQKRLTLQIAKRTAALHAFATEFLQVYSDHKQAKGFLDFNDLISRTRNLLSNENVAAWVLFRLDGGIDHILVDEAQDTSPMQWDVIKQLAQEFTSGQGARADVPRTIFVVGDKKQSIYSFQGADPEGFDRMRDKFEAQLHEIAQPFQSTTLDHSFRSSHAILSLVDQIFSDQKKISSKSTHLAFKETLPGRVDVWPVFEKPLVAESRHWTDPIDEVSSDHQDEKLAKALAAHIMELIKTETLTQIDENGVLFHRKITAGDFLILVQGRQKLLFQEIHRACRDANLPIAGADRLRVAKELAVRDLRSLLAFLAFPEDNLSLAEALRSPLFGWSEQDMFDLAQDRDSKFLWRSLQNRSDDFPDTVQKLIDLRNMADFKRPFELIEHVLNRLSGRKSLLSKLGNEAGEGLDALVNQSLAYERSNIPNLTGFLIWLDADDLEIKRQMDGESDKIRVMTVHGAKGLEAPIVILPDTAVRRAPAARDVVDYNGLAVWKPNTDQVPEGLASTLSGLQDRQVEERDRLLYVALTRAESWLIVLGSGEIKESQDCWYNTVRAAVMAKNAKPLNTSAGLGLRYEHLDWVSGINKNNATKVTPKIKVPNWVSQDAITPKPPNPIRAPSQLGGDKTIASTETIISNSALEHGSAVHLLLETLPTTNPSCWEQLARHILDEELFETALQEATKVLTDPGLAHVFAPETLAEVSLTAHLAELNGDAIQGSVDRLIVSAQKVTAVDFKTNQIVPRLAEETPVGILKQMGAYALSLAQIFPEHEIETAVLWTKNQKLMQLPHHLVTTSLQTTSTS